MRKIRHHLTSQYLTIGLRLEQLLRIFRALQTSHVPHISMNAQLTYDLTNCFITFSTRWKIFFSRDLFDDVMSVHNGNMKHAHAIEFD